VTLLDGTQCRGASSSVGCEASEEVRLYRCRT